MKKVFIISPKSIAGELIIDGFACAFKNIGYRVLLKKIDEVTLNELEKFNPDIIFGYDYSYLTDQGCKEIIQKIQFKNRIFYFGDEPKSKFSLGEKNELYDELSNLDATVFVWDKAFTKEFKKCYYLPLAVNPLKYATEFSGYKYAITFVGRPLTDKRQKILSCLVKSFGNKLNIFCYEKHFEKSVEEIKEKKLLEGHELEIYKKSYKGFVKTESELAKIYNSSEINLNITEQGKSSLNYRVFEVLASGGFLLTDEKKDVQKYFIPSKQLETYKNETDLTDKIEFYFQNPGIAQRIAHLGRYECIKSHSFDERIKTIIKKIT
ncbi:MAG TPA: glycosyltransferase [Candidatus Gastranaerophilaceae bacterium]|nr:glycosyltransferase [Candidatus Gastranaerophilaceae bacterium]